MSYNLFFYLFSIFLVFSAFMVIVSQHAIFSLLFLVASFIFSAFLLFLLECEFIALLFIIIYVGAIAILFLFAVMMLEAKFSDLSRNVIKYLPIGMFFGLGFLLVTIYEVNLNFEENPYYDSFFFNYYQNWYDLADSATDVEIYGQVLYSYFVLQLLITGLILLMVLVGVVYLTNTYSIDKQTQEQSAFKQLSRESKFFFKN